MEHSEKIAKGDLASDRTVAMEPPGSGSVGSSGDDEPAAQGGLFDLPAAEVKRVSGRKGVVTPGQVLENFNARFLDEESCRRFLLGRIHTEGPACPGCKAMVEDGGRLRRFWYGGRLACSCCGKFFTARTDTFLAGSQMEYREVFTALMLLALNRKNTDVAAAVGCSPETIRLWRRRIKILREIS